MKLELVPISITDARLFVKRHHRHLPHPPAGSRFAVAVAGAGKVRGVALVGNPLARHLCDGWTLEVSRVAVEDGTPNACSMLYGASWRVARALGYRRLVTYTLASEPGTSLRASGWMVTGQTNPQSWNRKNRPRVDRAPAQRKLRWEPMGSRKAEDDA